MIFTLSTAPLPQPSNNLEYYANVAGLPGAAELPRTQDSDSGPIYLPLGSSLLFGDEVVKEIYVSKN